MPWSPRCVDKPAVGVYSTKLASITLPSSPYTIYGGSCAASSSNNLGYVVNEIWGPTPLSFGGNDDGDVFGQFLQQMCEQPGTLPLLEASMTSLIGRIARRQIVPGSTRA